MSNQPLWRTLPTTDLTWEKLKENEDAKVREAVYIEVHDPKPNHEGFIFCSLYWFAPDYHLGPSWRGQVFLTDLDERVKKYQQQKRPLFLFKRISR